MIAITPHTTGIPTSPLSSMLPRPPAVQMQPQDTPKQSVAPPAPGRLLDITT